MNKEKLVTFLYLLIRNELPAERVAGLIRRIQGSGKLVNNNTNNYLESYARELANTLLPENENVSNQNNSRPYPTKKVEFEGHCFITSKSRIEPAECEHCLHCGHSYSSGSILQPCRGRPI
jgi:hypothetical protein